MKDDWVNAEKEKIWRTDWVLRNVMEVDFIELYDMLEVRDIKINISHRELPAFIDHVRFWRSKPYKWCQAIVDMDAFIGYCYVTERNEIGIHIKAEFQKTGIGTQVLDIIIKKFSGNDLFMNVSPKNFVAMKIIKRAGFNFIQKTFRLSNSSSSKLP